MTTIRWKLWLGLIAAGLLLWGGYALTAPVNHSEANDAYGYAASVETASWPQLWHAQHLLYLPAAQAFFHLVHNLGLATRAFPVMVGLSRVCGVLAILVFFLLLKRRLVEPENAPEQKRVLYLAALAGAGGLAFSYGFWRYSNEAEIYAPAALLILLAWLAAAGRPTLGNVLLGGALAALACLMHILNVLPALLAIPVFYLLQHRIRHACLHGLLAGTATGIVYLGFYGSRVLAEIFSTGSDQPEGGLSLAGFVKGGIGLTQNIVAGNFLFASEKFQHALVQLFPYRALARQIFTGQHADALSRIAPFLTLALLVVAGLLLLTMRLRTRRGANLPRRSLDSALMVAAAIWFGLYMLIVLVSEPGGPENWVMALPPLWMLLTVALYAPLAVAGRSWLPLTVAALLCGHNYLGSIRLLANPQGDYAACKSAWLLEHAKPGDLIITADSFEFARYIAYYSRAETSHLIYDVTPANRDHWLSTVHQRSGRVFATAEVFELPPSIRHRFPQRAAFLEQLGRTLAPEFVRITTNEFGGVYAFKRSASAP